MTRQYLYDLEGNLTEDVDPLDVEDHYKVNPVLSFLLMCGACVIYLYIVIKALGG